MRSLIVAIALTFSACAGASDDAKPAPVELVKPTAQTPYDRTFVWKPVRGATSYRVLVFNSEGQRTFEVRDVKSTSVAVKAICQ